MDKGGLRKQWQKGTPSPPKMADASQTPRGMYEGPDKYDEYLLQLQRKNRILKQLKAKDPKQIEIERKEQGFALYVNGANVNLGVGGNVKFSPRRPATRKPKTAGDYPRRPLIGQLDLGTEADSGDRAKTAPGKVQRKNWLQASVDIKTEQGERLKLKSRLAQADYSEDFEVCDSLASEAEDRDGSYQDGQSGGEEDDTAENPDETEGEDDDYSQLTRQMTVILERGSDGDSDIEIDASQHTKSKQGQLKKPTKMDRRVDDSDGEESVEEDDDDYEGNEQLLLSIEDVKTLRRSLEGNPQIIRNICRKGTDSDGDSSSSDDDVIEEEDEDDIEEDIDTTTDSLDAVVSDSTNRTGKFQIEPGDMIVLDFAPSTKTKTKSLLAAKRKDSAEEINLLPRASQENLRKPDNSNRREIIMDSGPAQKKSTSLMAQKKKDDPAKWAAAPTDDLSAIQRAIAAENIAACAAVTREDSGVRSAPAQAETFKEANSPVQYEAPKRPSTVILSRGSRGYREASPEPGHLEELSSDDHLTLDTSSSHDPLMNSQNLDDTKLALALEKVKDMDARSQRRLLKVLGRLEDSTSPRQYKSLKATSQKQHPAQSSPEQLASDSDLFRGPKLAPRSKSAASSRTSSLEEKTNTDLEVILEINSNWGHPSRVGVTEIQLFDLEEQRLSLQPGEVMAHNADECKGELSSIVNGKMKTTREKNMWSCEFEMGVPVLLHFRVPSRDDSSRSQGISKVKIWNFNKSLKDLGMGIKEARLSIAGEVVWEGTVDKGCGNQVFDYSTVITLPKPKILEGKLGSELVDPRTLVKEQGKGQTHSLSSQSNEKQLGVSTGGERLDLSDETNPNRSNSNSNGDDDSMRRSIAFEIDLDLFPSSQSRKGHDSKLVGDSPTQTRTDLSKMRLPSKNSKVGVEQSKIPLSQDTSVQQSQNLPGEDMFEERTHLRAPDPTFDHNQSLDFSKGTINPDTSASLSVDDPTTSITCETLDEGGTSNPAASASFSANDPRTSIRCETRILMRSTDELDLPVVDDSIQIYATPRVSLDVNEDPDDTTPRPVPLAAIPSDKMAASTGSGIEEAEEPSMLQQLKELSVGQTAPRKPLWLMDDAKRKNSTKSKPKRPPWLSNTDVGDISRIPLDDDPLDVGSPWPGQHRSKSTDAVFFDDSLAAKEHPGRRTREVKSSVSMADDLEELRWRQQAVEGGGGISDHDDESLSPPAGAGVAGSKRPHHWRSRSDKNLEESWTSLSMFDKSQKGRLAPNAYLDMEGDALDTYLSGRRCNIQEEADEDSSDEFEIPVLPIGRCMTINIRSTWGDRHYVGLNGIEIFQNNGEHVKVSKITAEPLDLNILPEHTNDPRVVTNLLDGVNCTRDDIHMWLAPFTPGRMHLITLTFELPVKVAMIRIWNYNKSRIHSFRGAKDIEISLDDTYIFKGEIERASGALQGDPSSFGDTILFTEDEEILELISRHDEIYVAPEDWFSSSLDEDASPPIRPRTADVGEERPMTSARQNRTKPTKSEPDVIASHPTQPPSPTTQPEQISYHPPSTHDDSLLSGPHQRETLLVGRYLKLNFSMTWGDPHYLGLTGLEVLDTEGDGMPVSLDMMDASPRDLNELPNYDTDDRTLDKLIDGVNVTTSDEHMWMIPFTEGCDHILKVDFGRDMQMTGLRIWNYNKTQEDTYRGAKIVHVWLDGRQISPSEGYLIRKGPGNCFLDFAQDISFLTHTSWQSTLGKHQAIPDSLRQSQVAMEIPSQEYVPMHMPSGFVFQLQLLSTWGDQYYVGLNGLEFYDAGGERMELSESNIAAYPPSVNVLDGVSDDVRTPDKLIDGFNDTMDGRHMWLAPILPSVINRVYVIFDQPVTISMIKLWNYSKTPLRGVKEFGLLVDDLLVYNGILGQVTTGARGILPTLDVPTPYHTILFADNAELRRRERHTLLQNQSQDQDVQMTDDHQVMSHYQNPKKTGTKAVDQALRPKTSVPGKGVPRRR